MNAEGERSRRFPNSTACQTMGYVLLLTKDILPLGKSLILMSCNSKMQFYSLCLSCRHSIFGILQADQTPLHGLGSLGGLSLYVQRYSPRVDCQRRHPSVLSKVSCNWALSFMPADSNIYIFYHSPDRGSFELPGVFHNGKHDGAPCPGSCSVGYSVAQFFSPLLASES